MIPVTKPFLPPSSEYQDMLQGIWERNWLTNNGPLASELELKLKEFLDVPHLLFLGNGTIALQIAIKALGLSGEIITTPFSYVATSSSIVWEGCQPVFSDIDPLSFNIDPGKIEAAITSETSAILATHVFGNPCDIDAIQTIATRHNLKVIYDAAHCFGSRYKGKSVFSFGNVSTASFHATKIFHTIEGGAVFTSDPAVLKRMAFLRNFGHNGPYNFAEVGINGKNSEFHAAMGLVNLGHMPTIFSTRKALSEHYDSWLKRPGLQRLKITYNADFNYSYYPVVFPDEATTLAVIGMLEQNFIFPRRYFYPSLNTLGIYRAGSMPVSEDIAKRILCLPLYHTLSTVEIDLVCRIILRVMKHGS